MTTAPQPEPIVSPAANSHIRCARCDKPAVASMVDGVSMYPTCPCGSRSFNGLLGYVAPAPQPEGPSAERPSKCGLTECLGKPMCARCRSWEVAAPEVRAPVAEPVPRPGSPEASAMIDSVLAEYGWPANPKNAARAGFEAARRLAAPAVSPPPAAQEVPQEVVSAAARDVLAERRRQVEAEGWTPEHDDEHRNSEMAAAAAAYALQGRARGWLLRDFEPEEGLRRYQSDEPRDEWPWDSEWWKPKSPRRDLVRAGALILAEIERLDRALASPAAPEGTREP